MAKDKTLSGPRDKLTAMNTGSGLASDGMMGNGVNRDKATDRYSHNQFTKPMKENFGNKTFKGNASDAAMDVGPSATHDPLRKTIATAAQAKNPIESGFKMLHYGNPDKINVGNK